MPIPAVNKTAEAESPPLPHHSRLRLVQSSGGPEPAPLYARALAHLVDLGVAAGFSLPIAKVASALVVAAHVHGAQLEERAATLAFLRGFDYANSYLLGASFASFSAVYFVGLPLAFGRTPGMGVFGLRLQDSGGGAPGPLQLVARMAGCLLNVFSGGLLLLVGLRQRNGSFLQDVLSRTAVVRGD